MEAPQLGAVKALAAKLSRDGYKGCREMGDVENCLTQSCPCGEAALALGSCQCSARTEVK